MKMLLLIALGFTASCGGQSTIAEDVEDGIKSYFALPDRALTIVSQNISDSQKLQELLNLAEDCCIGTLRSRLLEWFSRTPLRSDAFHDDIQSMRAIAEPLCLPATFPDSKSANAVCTIETRESYSLSRNLDSVADLFKQFEIRNAQSADVARQVEEADIPELVELVLTVKKSVQLQVQEVGNKWLVSDAKTQPDFAVLETLRP